jgi:hypothetical protein
MEFTWSRTRADAGAWLPSFFQIATATVVATVLAGSASAQGSSGSANIPAGHLPPPGQCSVWYNDRPPGQQPPPMNCDAARYEAYRTGGRVIYGAEKGRDDQFGSRDRDERSNDARQGRKDEPNGDHGRRECDENDRRNGSCSDATNGQTSGRRRPGGLNSDPHSPDDRFPGRRYPDDSYPDRDSYPRSMPEMRWGVNFGRGEAANEVRQWIRSSDVRARVEDANGDQRPEVVSWYDRNGNLVQRWIDDNNDGRADRVAIYEGDRIVRIIR